MNAPLWFQEKLYQYTPAHLQMWFVVLCTVCKVPVCTQCAILDRWCKVTIQIIATWINNAFCGTYVGCHQQCWWFENFNQLYFDQFAVCTTFMRNRPDPSPGPRPETRLGGPARTELSESDAKQFFHYHQMPFVECISNSVSTGTVSFVSNKVWSRTLLQVCTEQSDLWRFEISPVYGFQHLACCFCRAKDDCVHAQHSHSCHSMASIPEMMTELCKTIARVTKICDCHRILLSVWMYRKLWHF